jgi:hypothetical protein
MSEYKMFSKPQLSAFRAFTGTLTGTACDPNRGAFDGKPRLKAGQARDDVNPEMMERIQHFMKKTGMNEQALVKIMQICSQELPANAGQDDFEDMPEGVEEEEGEYVEDESELEARQERMQRNTEPTDLQNGRLSVETQFKNSPLQQNIGKSLEDMPSRDGRFGGRRRAMDDPPDFASGGKPMPGGTMTAIKNPKMVGDAARRFAARYPNSRLIESAPPPRKKKVIAQRQERARAFLAMDSGSPNSFYDRFPDARLIKNI